MVNFAYRIYRAIFARNYFYKLNLFLYGLSLRGLGILNFESDKLSGEDHFINTFGVNFGKGIVFDVGANVGNYAKKLRRSISRAEIYCFEPHPVTFQKLRQYTAQLDVKLFNVGVGSAAGKLKLYDYADNDGSSHASLYKDVIEGIHKKKAVEHEVEVVALDEFVDKHEIERVHLIKIDTEGHELSVLKGFERFIRAGKVDLIHFEFNEMNIASRVYFKDFWDFLPDYDFYRMLPDGLIPIKKYSPVSCEIFAYQNIVAKLKTSARPS